MQDGRCGREEVLYIDDEEHRVDGKPSLSISSPSHGVVGELVFDAVFWMCDVSNTVLGRDKELLMCKLSCFLF